MHVNNRARWVKEFTVAGSVLCFKAGLPLSTFKRARLELRDKGFIVYTPRGMAAPCYEMVSLVDISEEVVPMEDISEETVEVLPVELTPVAPVDLPVEAEEMTGAEMTEIMREILEAGASGPEGEAAYFLHSSTLMFYMDHFGIPPRSVEDELYGWAERLGDGLVYAALERAVASGRLVWHYVRGILRNWKQGRLFTLDDVERSEACFRAGQGFAMGGSAGESKWKERACYG